MLQKTRGIALSFVKYKETSIIARFFTEHFGMQSYMVNGVRSKKSRTKIALYQPLSLTDMVIYHNDKKEINRISEIRSNYVWKRIPFDIKKTSVALFLTELLNQVLREEGANISLFAFIYSSLQAFDELEKDDENFHLHFLMQINQYLGIMPESSEGMLHDVGLKDGYSLELHDGLDHFLHHNSYTPVKLSKTNRNGILKVLLEYLRYHYDFKHELKSVQVLREVLN